MLSFTQRRLLRKIRRKPNYTYSPNEKSTILYLKSLGYITVTSTGGDHWGAGSTPQCNITELGRAYLYEVLTTALRFTIPVLISLASLVVSVTVLVTTA